MGDQHRRDPPAGEDAAQLVAQRLAQRQVERGERLVEQEQGGIGGERAAEGHPLALAARQLARVPLREGLEAEARQHLVFPTAPLAPAAVAEAEAHVAAHGEVREERVALEDVADPSALGPHVDPLPRIEEHLAVHHDAARVGTHEPGQALERERLARARGPEQGGDAGARAPLDVEGEPGQGLVHRNLEPARHAVRAPRRLAAISTTHESAVSTATRATASPLSPVCTAV